MGKKKFRFKNKLMGIDSSVIDLCLAVFDWAQFRRTKGAIKLHLILDHVGTTRSRDGYLPSFAVVSEGKVAEVKIAKQLKFGHGTVLVYDRAYIDYELFGRWSVRLDSETVQGVYFVTRIKENCLYEVVGEREVPKNRNILKDELIELRGYKALEKCPCFLQLGIESIRLQAKFNWSLSHLLALLRMNLFTYRDLWAWLNKPFETPPMLYEPEQLGLNFA